jgi:hypothetical protein
MSLGDSVLLEPKGKALARRLPHYEKATIDIEKLRTYVLNADHREGKHKARVFKSILGLERRHCDVFARIVYETLPRAAAVKGVADDFGERWTTYHLVIGINGLSAIVTAAWIYRVESPDVPSLVTCYIETGRQEELRKLLDLD